MVRNYTNNLEYEANFTWIDIVSPTEDELEKVAMEYSLNKDSVLKCLSPNHLPNLQEENGYYFIVFRAYDESSKHGEVVQAYTNKIVLFVNKDFLISIHRVDEPYLNKLGEFIDKSKDFFKKNNTYDLLLKIFKFVILSFEMPLHRNEFSIDSIEENRFSNKSPVDIFNDIYYIKRSTSVVKRTLWQSDRVIQDLYEILPEYKEKLNSIKETSERFQYLAEELEITAQNIVSLHISIASHRTSEVMRTLAIFSVFFMPLTFIVGIYGMNFTIMPELNWKYGYPSVLLFMIIMSICLYLWFKKKGWYHLNINKG
jgi:magnesium transporter